jgi:hypothetical protein
MKKIIFINPVQNINSRVMPIYAPVKDLRPKC